MARKKRQQAELADLVQQINRLDNLNATNQSTETHRKILALRYKYNQLSSDRITKAFIHTQQKYLELGEKPHKLLDRQLRKFLNDRTISKVKSQSGDLYIPTRH